MLIIGILLLAAFVYWEKIYANPLMPLHIWKDRNFTFVCSSPPTAARFTCICIGENGLPPANQRKKRSS